MNAQTPGERISGSGSRKSDQQSGRQATAPDLEAVRTYDFTTHSRLELESAGEIGEWLSAFCGLFKEFWEETAGTPRSYTARYGATTTFKNCRQSIPPTAVAFQVLIGQEQTPSIIWIERQAALAYALEMTGDECAQLPDDRPLSPIETALIETLFGLLAVRIGEAWPQQEPIRSLLGEALATPHRSRLFAPDTMVVTHQIVGQSAFGEHSFTWIAPQALLEELFASADATISTKHSKSDETMQEISLSIPLEICVILGETSVLVSELPQMKLGDVIVLNQKISEPVSVLIGEERRFAAWPSRVGARQAIQIDTVY